MKIGVQYQRRFSHYLLANRVIPDHSWSSLDISDQSILGWFGHFGLGWPDFAHIYSIFIITVLNEQYLRVSSNQFFVEMFRHNHHKQKASPLDAFSYALSSLTIVKMICHRFCNCVVFRLKYMVKLYWRSRIRLPYDALWLKICLLSYLWHENILIMTDSNIVWTDWKVKSIFSRHHLPKIRLNWIYSISS